MTTVQQAYDQLRAQLQPIYDHREAAAVASAVVRHITGLDNSGRLLHKMQPLAVQQQAAYEAIVQQLLAQKPLQYALHEAAFYGLDLYVDENVLIPRPETEELVHWIIQDTKNTMLNMPVAMLDIGTGSGCIPIALKKHIPAAAISAIDISDKALAVAKKNADAQHTPVQFLLLDILNRKNWEALSRFNVVVSNPPYITQKEKAAMHNNVLQHEPHTALFVPDEEPLLFYEAIALFGLQHLEPQGRLYFEINEAYGKEVIEMLWRKAYREIELRKDMQGKDRMIRAVLFG